MTRQLLLQRTAELLGREVTAAFVARVIDGDPFVYQRALIEDREAASTVLGLASGRLS